MMMGNPILVSLVLLSLCTINEAWLFGGGGRRRRVFVPSGFPPLIFRPPRPKPKPPTPLISTPTRSCPCSYTWASCSRSCGRGTRTATFSMRGHVPHRDCLPVFCYIPPPEPCNDHCCPVHCAWGPWGMWGQCSSTCGPGTRTRSRDYSNHAACGGVDCFGPSTETSSCYGHPCPVHCEWDQWSSWGSCNASCGGGIKRRGRGKRPVESYGGKPCYGPTQESESCNNVCCPDDCEWSEWTPWSECTTTCGQGIKSTRSRTVLKEASCGGSCSGVGVEDRLCNDVCCPIDCEWNQWGSWGACSASCGNGTAQRVRSVSITQSCDGRACEGPDLETQWCNTGCCQVDCDVTSWSDWSTCPDTCTGSATTLRRRNITNIASCGGKECPVMEENRLCEVLCSHGDNSSGYGCSCDSGWTGLCCEADTNECESQENACPPNSECLNNDGSYTCPCLPGFIYQRGACQDIDECAAEKNGCHQEAICDNLPGSYDCYCKEGLSGDGRSCVGVDECSEHGDFSLCHQNATCTDLHIGYNCSCGSGLTGDGFTHCTDIDECANAQDRLCEGEFVCKNTQGSYECVCPKFLTQVGSECQEAAPDFQPDGLNE